MRSVKNKKTQYQKETRIFMWIWILLFGLGIVLELIDVAFGDTLDVKSTILSALYLIFFCFGYYFAKKGNVLAGIFELVAGTIMVLNDLIPDKGIGLNGIIGVLVTIHSIMYIMRFKKNK